MKSPLLCMAALLLGVSNASMSAPPDGADMFKAHRGLYRVGPDHIVGIDGFIADDSRPTMLFSDYRSGIVRRLFQVSDNELVVGPNFNVQSPAEIAVSFVEQGGTITGITLRPIDGAAATAQRMPLTEQEVVFESGDATLSGTLIIPEGVKPRPAIALLHGSGPLTRYSFGPYPRFFASLGFAVLVYDKRGTGASTGTRVDASTGRAMAPRFYPDDLRNDALAALALLRGHPDIDATKVGFWGSSEGGMLATQAAAHSSDVAFAINSSGFMGPLWQTTLYQAEALPRQNGASQAEILESAAFTQQWLDTARTGQGWDDFVVRREEIRAKTPRTLFWSSGQFESVDEMRWYWDHVLSFDPLPALKNVKAPVLGVFGGADPLTDAPVAAQNLRRAVAEGGNQNVTVRIFPDAGHSLNDASGGRMAPGVFDTLRAWLATNVLLAPGVAAQSGASAACALLTTPEVRAASGHDYDAGDEGDAPGEGLGGGSSCQWGGTGFGPGKRLPLLSLVLIPRGERSYTEAGLQRKPREECTRERVRDLGELAYLEVCARSRGPVAYVKAGAHDLVVQMDAEPPATAASVKPAVLAVAQAAAAKLRAP